MNTSRKAMNEAAKHSPIMTYAEWLDQDGVPMTEDAELERRASLDMLMRERVRSGINWLTTRSDHFWDDFARTMHKRRSRIIHDQEWYWWIRTDELDMAFDNADILGLLGTSSRLVQEYVGFSDKEMSQLGFSIDEEEYGYKPDEVDRIEHYHLTLIWIEQITFIRIWGMAAWVR